MRLSELKTSKAESPKKLCLSPRKRLPRASKQVKRNTTDAVLTVTGDHGDMQEAAERRLIEQAMKGDLSAFDALMEQHQERVYSLAYRMTRSHEMADTVTQDVFLKAFRGLSGFEGGSRMMTWLHTITVRAILDQQRAHKRKPPVISLTQTAEPHTNARRTPDTDPISATEFSEMKETLGEAMMKLPEDQRAALVLVTQEGLSYREAAQTLGVTVGTVSWQIWKARQQLKTMLSSYLNA